jgi:hypothetical protein
MQRGRADAGGGVERVKPGSLSLTSAATVLGVSDRQAKRLAQRYRTEGAKALRHRECRAGVGSCASDGRADASIGAGSDEVQRRDWGSVRPALAAEHLASEDGIAVRHDTLRRWMLAAGLWSRARKRAPHRQRRERKAHLGELVQLDGSLHHWYEARGPRGCLMNLVDDARGARPTRTRARPESVTEAYGRCGRRGRADAFRKALTGHHQRHFYFALTTLEPVLDVSEVTAYSSHFDPKLLLQGGIRWRRTRPIVHKTLHRRRMIVRGIADISQEPW